MKLIVFFFVLKLHTLLNIFVFKIQPSKSSNLILHIYEVISHFNKKKKKITNTSRIFNRQKQVFYVLVCIIPYFAKDNPTKSQSAPYILLCYSGVFFRQMKEKISMPNSIKKLT